jgi:hypothetical protein
VGGHGRGSRCADGDEVVATGSWHGGRRACRCEYGSEEVLELVGVSKCGHGVVSGGEEVSCDDCARLIVAGTLDS